METLLFSIVIIALVFCLGFLVLSNTKPSMRMWPPPSKKSWQFSFVWTQLVIVFFGMFVLGILDWNTYVYDHWSRFIIGGLITIIGNWLSLRGISILGRETTLGLGGELVTRDVYKYSRNPQYIGDIFRTIGWIMISNSQLVLIAGIIAIICNIIAPFVEEPWLHQYYGPKYAEYKKRVPRFIGINGRGK